MQVPFYVFSQMFITVYERKTNQRKNYTQTTEEEEENNSVMVVVYNENKALQGHLEASIIA